MKLKLLSLVCLLCGLASAQQYSTNGAITAQGTSCPTGSGSSGAAAACVVLQLSPSAYLGSIAVSGTFTATLQFEMSPDGGTTWTSASATPSGGGTAVSSTSTAGVWTLTVSPMTFLRVRGASYSSGIALVTLNYGTSTSPGTASMFGCSGSLNNLVCGSLQATGNISATNLIASGSIQTTGLNGGHTFILGNGSGAGASVGNVVGFGNNTIANPCLELVVAIVDQGCALSAGLNVPSIDRSVGITTAAMTAQSSATLTPITNMSWNLVASKNYIGWCEVPVTFAASATIAFGLVGPGTPTSYNLDAFGLIGAAAVYGDISLQAQTTWVTTKTGASGAPGAVTEIVHVNFQIQNGTTAGALTLDTAANGTNTITIGANATCHVIQQN